MDLSRYIRQMTFSGLGVKGQEILRDSNVAIMGAGGLGSVISEHLCRAGIGKITLADCDVADITNLHRQFLYTEEDVRLKRPKASASAAHLAEINSDVVITPVVTVIDASNIEELIKDAHVVIDATDNFDTRALIGEACQKHKKPWIYGAALASSGAVMNIFPNGSSSPNGSLLPQGGPCFRCLIHDIPERGTYPTCKDEGVISMLTVTVASLQTAEAMKILIGSPDVSRKYLDIDVWMNNFEYVEISPDPNCRLCVREEYEFLG